MNTNSQSRPLICTYIGSMPPCRSNACLLLIRLHNMYNQGLTLVLDITSLVVQVLCACTGILYILSDSPRVAAGFERSF